MGRNKHNTSATAAAGRSVKERHQRLARDNIAVPRHLAVLPEKTIKTKHQSYFQFFENKDKRDKKLEFSVTTDANPPPGFEFVPIGNPELTQACKELSREQDALVFIVSGAKDAYKLDDDDNMKKLALHVHRMGHHVRQTIVEQAKELVGKGISRAASDNWQLPETQEEINAQAEAALRDLFPRIPNFDKQMIVEHAFKKGEKYGKPKVGTSDLPLYRRVQLAVLAHIRHTHTRYDQLLREVEWHVARKAVEKTCLDILVKWRGDEETGRDQIDDILREVVVISDNSDGSDDSDDSDDGGEESSDDDSLPEGNGVDLANASAVHANAGLVQPVQRPTGKQQRKAKQRNRISKQLWTGAAQQRKPATSKKDKRGFKRYEAVKQRWAEAVDRNRQAHKPDTTSHAPMDRVPSQSGQQRPLLETMSPVPRIDAMRDIRQHSLPQPCQSTGQDYAHGFHIDEAFAANHHREERQVSHAHRSDSGPGFSGGAVIGRRVGYPPIDPRAAPAPARPYHGDLKDLLVPSVEPISPRSWQEAPQAQSVRRVIREDPMRPEQVPARQIGGPSQQIFSLAGRPAGAEIRNISTAYECRPETGERLVPRRDYNYERDTQPYPVVHEVSRVYRVREPVESRGDPYSGPLGPSTRVVRIHREARPTELWEAGPVRRRDPSPHRMDPYSGAPLAGHGAAEHRRIVYRETSASGFEPHVQGPAPAPAPPLFYDVGPPAQKPAWQGSTFVRPAPFSAQPLPPEVSRDGMVRYHVQDPAAIRHASAEYHHIGAAHHERIASNHLTGAPASTDRGSVEYLYEQQVPPRDVVILR